MVFVVRGRKGEKMSLKNIDTSLPRDGNGPAGIPKIAPHHAGSRNTFTLNCLSSHAAMAMG